MQTQELRTKYLMILVVHMCNRVMYIFWISGRLDAIHHIVSFHRAVIVARLYYGDFLACWNYISVIWQVLLLKVTYIKGTLN